MSVSDRDGFHLFGTALPWPLYLYVGFGRLYHRTSDMAGHRPATLDDHLGHANLTLNSLASTEIIDGVGRIADVAPEGDRHGQALQLNGSSINLQAGPWIAKAREGIIDKPSRVQFMNRIGGRCFPSKAGGNPWAANLPHIAPLACREGDSQQCPTDQIPQKPGDHRFTIIQSALVAGRKFPGLPITFPNTFVKVAESGFLTPEYWSFQ